MPRPRPARLLNCLLISGYGAGFFPLLSGWADTTEKNFALKVGAVTAACFAALFLLMFGRRPIYFWLCRLLRREVRLFEFGFFRLVCFTYGPLVMLGPLALGNEAFGALARVFSDKALAQYIVFSGGCVLAVAVICGLDIYPVNLFRSKASLEHLIAITRDLMRLCNRILLVVTGSIIAGWVFKKVEFSLTAVYVTTYGVVGFAFGSTGVLGTRVTELLYRLDEMEEAADNRPPWRPKPVKPCPTPTGQSRKPIRSGGRLSLPRPPPASWTSSSPKRRPLASFPNSAIMIPVS